MSKDIGGWALKLAFIFTLWIGGTGPLFAAEHQTSLDAYVHKPDTHYRYDVVERTQHEHDTVFHIRMVSQVWRTPADVTQPEWVHWLEIYVPDTVSETTGLLFITGGSTRAEHPKTDTNLESIAVLTHSVVAELHDVPNEPFTFVGDPHGPRDEDEIIAYTWRKYLETGDQTWPLRLPMTKAAVRAMDTVTSFMAGADGGKRTVNRFVVAGASKRGWTTWTTAAVDQRVCAIIPMVIDVLNVVPSFKHHYGAYGFWAEAVDSYFNEGLMDRLDNKAYKRLMEIEDPYSYRARYTMPKLLINASGDQFFLPDSSRFYFDKLPGEKHLLYEPNTDHSLHGSTVYEDVTAFYISVLRGTQRPRIESHFDGKGTLNIQTEGNPTKVILWQATNSKGRDFRLRTIGSAYHPTELKPVGHGKYVARVKAPDTGWTAIYAEAEFPADDKFPLHFSTPVYVLPNVEPHSFPRHGKTLSESTASSQTR